MNGIWEWKKTLFKAKIMGKGDVAISRSLTAAIINIDCNMYSDYTCEIEISLMYTSVCVL